MTTVCEHDECYFEDGTGDGVVGDEGICCLCGAVSDATDWPAL